MIRWKHQGPPFLLGAALGMAGVVASGLLLYGGPGFMPALSVILAILFLSLGAGLVAPRGSTPAMAVEIMRRQWFRLLLACAAAALFAGSWEVFRGFGAHGVTQAAGLALLAALPFYFGGALLGSMTETRTGPHERSGEVPAAALAGAAAGVFLLTHLLFPQLSPTAILLVSLVFISSGALIHGWALDEVVQVDQVVTRTGPAGRIQTERWVRGTPRQIRRALRENGRLRAVVEESDGHPVLPEEVAIVDALAAWGPPPERILSLGPAAIVLGRYLQARMPQAGRTIVDRDPALAEALEKAAFAPAESSGTSVEDICLTMDPADVLAGAESSLFPGSADWILVDALSLGATPEGLNLSGEALARLQGLLGPEGLIFVFPLAELPGSPTLLATLLERAGRFPRRALYMGGETDAFEDAFEVDMPPGRGRPRVPLQGGVRRAFLVLGSVEGEEAWPERTGGFLRVSGSGD